MFYPKRQLCIVAATLILCGCAQGEGSTLELTESSRQTEQQRETEGAGVAEDGREEIEETENIETAFPKITVIDTLPEVDETVPNELTPLPSSEIMNIMGQEEAQLSIRQENGSFFNEQFNVYNVICHDHDVSFAMPEGGQIIWRGSGVSVRYIGVREQEIIKELDEKNVFGDYCWEFNEGSAKTRQLIAEGFL